MACINPITLQSGDIVPCSKCLNCKKRRVSGWSFRLMQQLKISQSARFITLTYDTNHVPITKRGFMSLDKTDFQKFIKRLRKAQKDVGNIKYYAVGEYGGRTMRPHYHAIIFNADVKLIQPAWSLNGIDIGMVHYGEVNEATIGYTLKYISKASKVPLHRNDDRVKEFSLMSKDLASTI